MEGDGEDGAGGGGGGGGGSGRRRVRFAEQPIVIYFSSVEPEAGDVNGGGGAGGGAGGAGGAAGPAFAGNHNHSVGEGMP